jgi:hypothetical protein
MTAPDAEGGGGRTLVRSRHHGGRSGTLHGSYRAPPYTKVSNRNVDAYPG